MFVILILIIRFYNVFFLIISLKLIYYNWQWVKSMVSFFNENVNPNWSFKIQILKVCLNSFLFIYFYMHILIIKKY